jgi:Concanavalin A-like lectin/glucanases superfamily
VSAIHAGINAKVIKRDFAHSLWSLALLQNKGSSITDESSYGATVTVNGGAQIVTENTVPNGRAIEFDGTGDSLTLANAAQFDFGTGDWLWEAIVKPDVVSGTYGIFDTRHAGNTNLGMVFITAGTVRYFEGGTTRITGSMSATKTHILCSRVSGTTRLFVDGVSAGSYADSRNYNGSVPTIGDLYVGGLSFDGKLAQIRWLKGAGRDTTFAPPAAVYGRL